MHQVMKCKKKSWAKKLPVGANLREELLKQSIKHDHPGLNCYHCSSILIRKKDNKKSRTL